MGVTQQGRWFNDAIAVVGGALATAARVVGTAQGTAFSVEDADTLVGTLHVQGVNEAQVITIGGGATGGTFTLTWGGYTTAAIPFGATAAVVQAALNALPVFTHTNDVTVTGTGPYTITFGGYYAGLDVAQFTGSAEGLTGGTPTLTPSTSTPGGTGITGTAAVSLETSSDGGLNYQAAASWPTKSTAGTHAKSFNVRGATHARWAWTVATATTTFAVRDVGKIIGR